MDDLREAYINLNNAIWGKAVEDDCRNEKKRMFYDVTEKIFNCLLKYPKEKRDSCLKIENIVGAEYGQLGIELVQEIEHKIDSRQKQLRKLIQYKVYRESLEWPKNRKGRKDEEYETGYYKIRDNILKILSRLEGVS